jgi:hypothetical protein
MLDTRMPGAGRSESAVIRTIGYSVAVVAVGGYLLFGWSFDSDRAIVPTVIGVIVAASAIGWTLYNRVYSDKR